MTHCLDHPNNVPSNTHNPSRVVGEESVMHISNNKFKFLVVLMMTFVNISTVSAQPPGSAQATTATPATPATPAPTASVPANPQAWCQSEGYCDGSTPPPPVIIDDTPPPQPRPRACIWGQIRGGRQVRTHDAANMTVNGVRVVPGRGLPATVDTGIGGECICTDASDPDAIENFLPADANHTPRRAVQNLDTVGRLARTGNEICMPRTGSQTEEENAPPVGVDLRPIITWLTSIEGSVCRVHATNLCQNMVYELNACESRARMNRDEASFNACFEQHSYNGSVTIAESDATTGELESCGGMTFECSALGVNYAPVPALPADEVGEGGSNDESRMHYRLRLGGQFMIGSSIDSTLMTGGLATLGVELFSANNRHGLILRGEIGSADMRGNQGHAPIGRATLFGGSLAYGFRPLNWATIALGGRVLGMSDHNGDPDVYHGYRGTLAGPELALTLDRQIGDGPFGISFRVSASFLRGQVNYWINSQEIQAGRSSVNLGLGAEITYGR